MTTKIPTAAQAAYLADIATGNRSASPRQSTFLALNKAGWIVFNENFDPEGDTRRYLLTESGRAALAASA